MRQARMRFAMSRLLCQALLLCVCWVGMAASAQTSGSGGNPGGMALNGPWKFHAGDDGQWARPEFDDNAWENYVIAPRESTTMRPEDAVEADRQPGWQAHGHPGLTGYGWYRIRIERPADIREMALLVTGGVDDAYELFVNGVKVGEFGRLGEHSVVYAGRSRLFAIPPGSLQRDPREVTIAIRMWCLRSNGLPSEANRSGGLHGVPVFGPAKLLRVLQRGRAMIEARNQWQLWLLMSLFGVVGLISIFLFAVSRTQREYLWVGVSFVGIALVSALGLATFNTAILSQTSTSAYVIALQCISLYSGLLGVMYLLDVPRPRWRRLTALVIAGVVLHGLISLGLTFGVLPPNATEDTARLLSFYWLLFAPAVVAIAMALDGVRTHGRKAWLPLTPGLFFAGSLIAQASGRFLQDADAVTEILLAGIPLAVFGLFLARFVRQQRENVRLTEDVEQAKAVQLVLVPEATIGVRGLKIESDYRPAREVGGDFFQVLPHAKDGSTLIVLGDVTGKGLQAGMMVALIVGAIRTEAVHTNDPVRILRMLNQRLFGRGEAVATCLALRIAEDGAVVLANAGHLPPYLNGEEMAMGGALPLGILPETEFSVMGFGLEAGDVLTLMSDGIAEAKDEQGVLFGFDRIGAMLKHGVTTAELAEAAERHGQEDDILVLRVEREQTPARHLRIA